MKKIYLYLIGFVALFAVAFIIYQSNLDSPAVSEDLTEEHLVVESVESVESSSESEEAPTNSTSVSEVSEESVESESESQLVWQGPSTTYADSDGDIIRLSQNLGKPTIINIWASWCPPCRDEMPYFETSYQEHGSDINFVMLNALESRPTETKQAAIEFADEMNLSMPIYFDNNASNQIEFAANMLPLTALLDADGEVIEVVRGQVSPAKLKQLIAKVS